MVAKCPPSLDQHFASVALGPRVFARLGDLERGLGVVPCGNGVVVAEGDAGADDQAIGVDEAVVARGGELERPLAGGEGRIEVDFAEVAGCAGEVDAREFLDHVAASEGCFCLVEVAVGRGPLAVDYIEPAEYPIAPCDTLLPRLTFTDLPVVSGYVERTAGIADTEEVFGTLDAGQAVKIVVIRVDPVLDNSGFSKCIGGSGNVTAQAGGECQ